VSDSPHLTLRAAVLLTIPPILWAGNAIVGRLIHDMVSPMTMNFFRWLLAFALLWPLAKEVLRLGGPVWRQPWRYAILGLLGIGSYNSLQYLALQTSSPINTTLVGSSMPVFMLLFGVVFFKQRLQLKQLAGAALSIGGVLLVLGRGSLDTLLHVQLVSGDLYMLLATAAWAGYSWMLSQPKDEAEVRSNWAYFLLAQMGLGLGWSGGFSALEWGMGQGFIVWSWPLLAALIYIALGPALVAYRCWGLGVQLSGPNIASFFANLTPLFAALMSALVLGEGPQLYHAIAFLMIIGGIVVSARRRA
jgi:drug/metabolite transporter (DMT)-like permease